VTFLAEKLQLFEFVKVMIQSTVGPIFPGHGLYRFLCHYR